MAVAVAVIVAVIDTVAVAVHGTGTTPWA